MIRKTEVILLLLEFKKTSCAIIKETDKCSIFAIFAILRCKLSFGSFENICPGKPLKVLSLCLCVYTPLDFLLSSLPGSQSVLQNLYIWLQPSK